MLILPPPMISHFTIPGRRQSESGADHLSCRKVALFVLTITVAVLGAQTPPTGKTPEVGEGFPFDEVRELQFLKTGEPLADWNPLRTWTSTEGKTIRAKVLSVGATDGEFFLSSKKSSRIPLSRLSDEDRRFLKEWAAVSAYFNTGFEAPRRLLEVVEADMFDGAFAKEGKSHETRNFRFESDVPLTRSVAKDLSQLFEVTYIAVSQLPLGLTLGRSDQKKIEVRLFANYGSYLSAGGSDDALGVYSLKTKLVLVPLSSLGIVRSGSGRFRKEDFDPTTLIHETTHAVMDQWLKYLPPWVVEGLAEYVAALPYDDGTLDLASHDEGMVSLIAKRFGGKIENAVLLKPEEFVDLDLNRFMGGDEPIERPLNLRPFQTYHFRYPKLVSAKKAREDQWAKDLMKSLESDPPITIDFGPEPPPDPDIIPRYISSMLLVRHLIEEQPIAFRKYLFSLLQAESNRYHFLREWNKHVRIHTAKINKELKTFNGKWIFYVNSLNVYESELRHYNRTGRGGPPTYPDQPKLPEPIDPPEFLTKPKSTRELSSEVFRREARETHLKLPDSVAIPAKRK